MPIYKGNHKIDKISLGNNTFAKVYKGSQKVYEQKAKGLPVFYGMTTSDSATEECYVIGAYTTSNPLVTAASVTTIRGISGNLGSSGSSIIIQYNNYSDTDITLFYVSNIIINNILVYYYNYHGNNSMNIYQNAYVLENSIIGSTVIGAFISFGGGISYPSSLTDTQIGTYINGYAYTRDSSKDKLWTINGLI